MFLERAANIVCIIAVATFLAVVVPRQFLARTTVSPQPPTARVGYTITAPGVHFNSQRESLVLGISAHCHFCQSSLPFYRQLTYQLRGKVNFIALLPEDQAEAEDFIKKADLVGTQVVSDNLSDLGVDATPTLLVVDRTGKVTSTWVGELDYARQQKLIATLVNGTPVVPPD